MPKRKRVADEDRFNFMQDAALEKKREELKNDNTIKADKKAEKLFVTWLKLRKVEEDYWTLENRTLDEYLCKFWFEIRTVEGNRYKTATLANFCYGINRCLKKKGRQVDIVHSTDFIKSQEAFADACRELKQLGFGTRTPYKAISPQGEFPLGVLLIHRSLKY